jgi:hypothetical protein
MPKTVVEYQARKHADGSVTAWAKGAGNRIWYANLDDMHRALSGHFAVGEQPVVFFLM